MVATLEGQQRETLSAKSSLERELEQTNSELKKAQDLRNESCMALLKLDEARIVMNKLLGPQGPLTMSERHKFLGQPMSNETSADNTINDKSGVFYTNGVTQMGMKVAGEGQAASSIGDTQRR